MKFGVLLVSLLVLVGCGGGGGAVSSANVPSSTTVQGTVASDYGNRSLTVVSAWSGSSQPAQSGRFITEVSTQSDHVLFAVDTNNLPYAITVSLPGVAPAFSKSSTAATLIYMSPGIYTKDPAAASGRLQAIQAMVSFPVFLGALSAQGSSDLVTALSNPSTKQALLSCFTEWFSTHSSAIYKTRSITSETNGIQDLIPFGVFPSPDSSTDVNVQNAGFRVLEVYEKLFPVDGSTPKVTRLSDMSGATGVSLLDAILLQIGEPSSQDFKVDLSASGNYRAEFYFRGLGSLPGNFQVPADVTGLYPALSSADIKTLYWYVISPILDSISGFADYLNYENSWLDLIDEATSSVSIGASLQDLRIAIGSGDSASISLAAIHVAGTIWDATKDSIKEMLGTYFESLGYGVLASDLKAAASELAMTIALTIDSFALYEFVVGIENGHALNMGTVMSNGSGGVTIK